MFVPAEGSTVGNRLLLGRLVGFISWLKLTVGISVGTELPIVGVCCDGCAVGNSVGCKMIN